MLEEVKEKRPVGRPKLPETILKEYEDEIKRLNQALQDAHKPDEELKQLAENVRIIQRALKGLGVDDDVFLGLINVKDIKERTRLDETTLISHAAMRIAANKWKRLDLFEEIADTEDPYYISLEGEGRKEGILLQQAKSTNDAKNLILNMPNTQGGPAGTQAEGQQQNGPTQPQKKGIFSRLLHR